MILSALFALVSCGSSYDKSPEDWSADVCGCTHEFGIGAPECDEKINELRSYYSDDDYLLHDKATTLIGQDCPEALIH